MLVVVAHVRTRHAIVSSIPNVVSACCCRHGTPILFVRDHHQFKKCRFACSLMSRVMFLSFSRGVLYQAKSEESILQDFLVHYLQMTATVQTSGLSRTGRSQAGSSASKYSTFEELLKFSAAQLDDWIGEQQERMAACAKQYGLFTWKHISLFYDWVPGCDEFTNHILLWCLCNCSWICVDMP